MKRKAKDTVLAPSQKKKKKLSTFVPRAGPMDNSNNGRLNVANWDTEYVCQYLNENGLAQLQDMFREQKISGKAFLMLTEPLLEKMGIHTMGTRLEVMQLVAQLQGDTTGVPPQILSTMCKVFHDVIHGHIDLHPLLVKIVDTMQFQRLRYIKQLGGLYYIFPGACHNRFEHSIGTGHLAGQLVQAIHSRQPELGLTEQDILCVQIAGLCHDLGHGPFSHVYDGKFMPTIKPECTWKHEDLSVKMFDHLVEVNNLMPEFQKYGIERRDITFIKEQIAGPLEVIPGQDWQYKGRNPDKSFLYEVVSNKRNGIDVDKWDYFARDCHQLGIRNNFDHVRFMKFARVVEVEGERQICSREKEVQSLYDLFYARTMLHRRAYQHKVKCVVEEMIVEALVKASDHIRIQGTDGKPLKLPECVDDMVAYSKLTDAIYQQILYSDDPKLEEAQSILKKIERRQLYKSVGQTRPLGRRIKREDRESFRHEIVTALSKQDLAEIGCKPLQPEDIIIQVVNLDYGMKDKNPIDNVRFYLKDDPNKAFVLRKDQVSEMLPETFWEQLIRVFCKKTDKVSMAAARTCFHAWCDLRHFAEPKGGGCLPVELTPLKSTGRKLSRAASLPAGAPRKMTV